MSKKIESEPKFLDVMDEIQNERKRLEKLVSSQEFTHNLRNWGWMKEWLAKTNEDHYTDWFDGECNVCGKRTRYFINMSFSFCDEYDCGMKICSKCLTKMKRIFIEGFEKTR